MSAKKEPHDFYGEFDEDPDKKTGIECERKRPARNLAKIIGLGVVALMLVLGFLSVMYLL